MKILLVGVNAKYIHSNPALYYLKSYALKMADDKELFERSIKIVQYTINQEKQDVLRSIFTEKPDVVAFSCYLWNIGYIEYLYRELHKVLPDVDIWLGGPEVSFDAEERLAKDSFLKGIMLGEGEESFRYLTNAYIYGKEPDRKILSSDILNFDTVPFPYEDLKEFDNKIIYYESSRGCPFRCSYCLSSVDRKVRLRDIDIVKKELKVFLDAKVPQVKFVDRTFNCNKEHTMAILKFLKENDNGVTNFHFEIAAELIDDSETEMLNSLRPGLVQLEIGVQTTNIETLKEINRNSDIDRLREIVKNLLAPNNMHVHLDLIAGLPYEDLASFKKSFNDVYAMHGHNLQLGFLKVLKGSPMADKVSEYDIKYLDEAPYEVLSTKWLSFEDIIELKGVENALETYYNSRQFVNTIGYIESKVNDYYSLYKGIADYYKENGLDIVNHRRAELYKILREWWLKDHPSDKDDIDELLLHDLYLRENLKSRPDFGSNGVVNKDLYVNYFKEEKYKDILCGYDEYSSAQVSRMVHIEKRRAGYVLYDYLHKDAIDGNAKTYFIGEL